MSPQWRQEVDELREASKSNEEKNVKMEENVKKLSIKMEGVKKSRGKQKRKRVP